MTESFWLDCCLPVPIPAFAISKKMEIEIAFLGNCTVGKTTIKIQFMRGCFVAEYNPTMPDPDMIDFIVDDKTYHLTILDPTNAEEFEPLNKSYFRRSKAFVLVYSITDREPYEQIEPLYEEIRNIRKIDDFVCVICANKADLENYRNVTTQEGNNLAKKNKMPIF